MTGLLNLPPQNLTEGRRSADARTFAYLLEGSCQDDSLLRIKVQLESTLTTGHSISFLPQTVAGMAFMCLGIGLVEAGPIDVGALVDTAATFSTS